MSPCRFWCLLGGEGDAFSAEADLEWDVEQLAKAIRQEKVDLRKLDTSDIVLLKLNEPIPVDPEDTLLQRLPKPITGFSIRLMRTAQVGDVLPHRPKKHLQIVVMLRGLPSFKKRRLDSPEPPKDNLDKWDLLWRTFWGNSAPQCFGKGSARIPDLRTLEMPTEETNYEFLKFPNDEGSFPCDLQRILITETYKSLYALLCKQDKDYTELPKSERLSSLQHSTVITGQPGTGKTVGLSCILVWRLQEKKPTIYCSNETHGYEFTSTGVNWVSLRDGKRIQALDKSIHCCALVDINPHLLKAPSQFQPSLDRQGRVVVATSPNPNHVITFKQNHAKTYYTPTWTWIDIYCAGLVQFPAVDPETLRDAYTKLAGIPRRCFRALKPEGNAHEMKFIKVAIDNIDNIDDFAKSATGPLPFKTNASHALVRMEPTDGTWGEPVRNLLSDHVADLVFDRIDLLKTLDYHSTDHLLRKPLTRCWAGKLFERAVHRAFRKGIEFEPEAMDDDGPPLRMQIKKAESESGGYFHTLSVQAERVGEEFLNQSTIDSVDILEDVTVLFQMTVSPSHSLNLKDITELTNELPAFAKKRICIVFLVPDHDTTLKPYKRQNIVIPLGVPKNVSDPVVAYKQYVYYFPMDKL